MQGDIKLKYEDGFGGYYYSDCNITYDDDIKIPFFDFGDEDILNIYIPDIPLMDDINIDFTTSDITSQSNIRKLYQLGIDFLNSMDSTKHKFVVTHQKNNGEIEVLYFDKLYHKSDDNNLKVRFYDHLAFVVGITINIDNQTGHTTYSNLYFGPGDATFRNYTTLKLDFYGMTRKGGSWKGNRMTRNFNQ